MDGVVNWFTKQKEDVAEGEEIWKNLKISILQNQGNGRHRDIGSFADIVSECLDHSDELKKFPSEKKLPICSLYHHLKIAAGIVVCLGIDRGYERKTLQKLRVLALLRGTGKLTASGSVMLEDVLSKINWLEDDDKHFIRTLSPDEEDLLFIADSISSASDRHYEVEFDGGVVRSSDKIFPHILKFSGMGDDIILGRDKEEDVGSIEPLDNGVYFYDMIIGGGLVADKYEELGEGEICLLALDIQGIQGFIKEAVKLNALRGGSAIIEDALKSAKKIISDRVAPEAILFAGGGNLVSFLPAKEEVQEEIESEIKRNIKDISAGGLRASVAVKNYEIEEVAKGFKDVLENLFREVETEKSKTYSVRDAIDPDRSTDVCPYCFRRKVGRYWDRDVAICEVCSRKIKQGLDEKRGDRPYTEEIACELDLELPKELSHIGDTIAVLSIDANMMGGMFTQTATPAEYSCKSETFDTKFKEILKETIADFSRKHLNLVKHNAKMDENDESKTGFIGLDVIYVGGDDVLVILNAKAALGFARELLGNVAEKFRFHSERYSTGTVTISAGIAFADYKFPVYFLIDRSEELIGDAKQGFRNAVKLNDDLKLFELPDGAMSFASITSSTPGRQSHIFVLPSDKNDLSAVLSYIESVQLKDYPRSMVSMLINCSEKFEDRLNLVKYLYSRLCEKELFNKAAEVSKKGTPIELCHGVCKTLAEKKKVRDGLKEVIPMVWVGDGE